MCRRAFLAGLSAMAIAGCGDNMTADMALGNDMPPPVLDLTTADKAPPGPDLTTPPDEALPADLATDDSSVPDMAVADLSVPDLSKVSDMAAPPMDLAGRDLYGKDLAVIPDLLPPPDLYVAPPNVDMLLPPTVISHDKWMAFCKAMTGCGLYSGKGLSFCSSHGPVAGNVPFLPSNVLACFENAAGDCMKTQQCLNNQDPNFQCDVKMGAQQACTNGIYSVCLQGNTKYGLDCTKFGLNCDYAGVNTYCGAGSCEPDGGAAQPCYNRFSTFCAGGNRKAREDCNVFANEACVTVDGGASACQGTGADCSGDTCMNDTLVACKTGKVAQFDCTSQALHCVAFDGGVANCRNGSACDPNTYVETCANNVLTYCDFGTIKTYDCVAGGWKNCVPKSVDGGVAGGYCSN